MSQNVSSAAVVIGSLLVNAYALMSQTNLHDDVSRKATDRKLSFDLQLHPYFVYESSIGSGESVHMHRLACVFAARWFLHMY